MMDENNCLNQTNHVEICSYDKSSSCGRFPFYSSEWVIEIIPKSSQVCLIPVYKIGRVPAKKHQITATTLNGIIHIGAITANSVIAKAEYDKHTTQKKINTKAIFSNNFNDFLNINNHPHDHVH
jgi:hypothetical protein